MFLTNQSKSRSDFSCLLLATTLLLVWPRPLNGRLDQLKLNTVNGTITWPFASGDNGPILNVENIEGRAVVSYTQL